MSIKLKICFFLSIIFILTYKTNQQDAFALLQLHSEQIIIVSYSSIYLQEKDLNISATIKINIDSSVELKTLYDHREISLAQYPDDQSGYILCRIKQIIYLISPDFSFSCFDTGLPTSSSNTIIVPYKKNGNSFIYFICYIDSTEIQTTPIHIEKYIFNKDSCTNILENNLSIMPKNSFGKSLVPQGICLDCNLMYNDILTCFFTVVNIYETGYISFDIKNNLTILQEFSGTSGIKNVQANWLRTIQSEDKTKILCCFTTNYNDIYCSIYNIIKNKWSNEIKILTKVNLGAESFYLKYFYETNEYLIYSSAGDNNKVDVVKLDKNFNIISTNSSYKYCYTKM